MRRQAGSWKWKAVGVVLVLFLAGGFYGWRSKRSEGPQFTEAKVERVAIESTVLSTGVVKPENRVEIKPPIAGRAERVLVQEGIKVWKGQTLVWMSSTERAALLDAARARGPDELKKWEDLYKPTPILAPVNGTIIQRQIEPGQTFSVSDSILVMSDRLIVEAQVDETDLAQIKLGQSATIILDAYPGQPIKSSVVLIAFEARTVNNVTTYVVKVMPQETPAFMRSGMTANVNFEVASKKAVLSLPAEAIKVQDGKPSVILPAEDGKTKNQAVKIGLSDGKRTEITEGLTEGDVVLIPVVKPAEDRSRASSNPFAPPTRTRNRGRN